MSVIRYACFLALASFVFTSTLIFAPKDGAQAPLTSSWHSFQASPRTARSSAVSPAVAYLPLIATVPAAPVSQWRSPLGVQPLHSLASGALLTRTLDLNLGWIRLGGRVAWSRLQPNAGDPIHWELLAGFEDELRALKRAGIAPIVSITSSPRWATINQPFPTSCGAIRPDKYAAFAQFVSALVARYHTPEFDVHNWELGNEPDIDPTIVGVDSVFGCWGDLHDPFYGGRAYGAMLKVVGPAVKAADPAAQVWIGGLLLDRPETHDPALGKPELFLKGILEAGAAPYFDVVAYHSYSIYRGDKIDYDTTGGWVWAPWGGRVLGKARFLRQLMSVYGVDKPVFVNEIALVTCHYSGCPGLDASFYELQADFIVRTFVRGISGGVGGFIWYTLDAPGYRDAALLDKNAAPKPVYRAYQQLSLQLYTATYVGPIDYGAEVEAYAFSRGAEQIQIVWTKDATTTTILIPQSWFRRATDRDGNPLTPIAVGKDYQLTVGFEPIYIILSVYDVPHSRNTSIPAR
jgi:hypothetical protein